MDPNQGSGGSGYPPPPGGPGYPPPPGGPGYPPPPGGPGYPPPGYGGPPPGGYPPPGYGGPPPPPAPAGINGLFRKWINVTTKPGAASFAIELPTANWGDIWLSIIGLGVLESITGFIGALYMPANFMYNSFTPDQRRALAPYIHAAPAASFGSIIGVPLGFFIGVGILFLVAKLFGGTGTFLQQAYAFALFSVPIQGVSAIAGLVPVLGGLAGFALWIYSIFLAVFAISASHRLSTGRSVAVVLLPAAIALVLACVLLIVFVTIIVAATQNH